MSQSHLGLHSPKLSTLLLLSVCILACLSSCLADTTGTPAATGSGDQAKGPAGGSGQVQQGAAGGGQSLDGENSNTGAKGNATGGNAVGSRATSGNSSAGIDPQTLPDCADAQVGWTLPH